MKRKSITLIIAAAATAVLAGGYFGARAWIKAHPKASPYSSFFSEETPRLTEFDSSKIAKIELSGFTLEKNGGAWELSPPPEGAEIVIDQSAVSNRLWSISSLWAESVIEREPEDLGQYGLAEPQGRAVVTDTEGKTAELFFGGMTPSRSAYYVMAAGDPAVYTVSSYSGDNFLFALDSIRDRALFALEADAPLNRFTLDPGDGGKKIDIVPRPETEYLVSNFSQYMLVSPYVLNRGVAGDKFSPFLEPLQSFMINEFVDDNPASLAPYGLDRPGRLFIDADRGSLDHLFGRGSGGALYAKRPEAPGVFTVTGLEEVIAMTPFAIVDKFAMIFNIDNVDTFTVSGEGRTLRADISGTGDEAEFFLNGRKAVDKVPSDEKTLVGFRGYYQAVIGLLADAEYPGNAGRTETPGGTASGIRIEFSLRDPAGARPAITLTPYNRDFYALTQSGVTEFVVSRTQVRNIYTAADNLMYEEQ
jgi:hypothetical protein